MTIGRARRELSTKSDLPRTLCFDIGGTHIKAAIVDEKGGAPSGERSSKVLSLPHGELREGTGLICTGPMRVPTPSPARPPAVLSVLEEIASNLGSSCRYDRVSVGFPGVVKDGRTFHATNLHPDWEGHFLARTLSKKLARPVRIANDADVQGLAAISGAGIELLFTFGTGVGAALYTDGRLVPNLQLGHLLFKNKRSYEDYLGARGLEKRGLKKWNRHLREMIAELEPVFNYDRVYLGGGNAKKIDSPLPKNVLRIDNIEGILGGVALWHDMGIGTYDASSATRRQPASKTRAA